MALAIYPAASILGSLLNILLEVAVSYNMSYVGNTKSNYQSLSTVSTLQFRLGEPRKIYLLNLIPT